MPHRGMQCRASRSSNGDELISTGGVFIGSYSRCLRLRESSWFFWCGHRSHLPCSPPVRFPESTAAKLDDASSLFMRGTRWEGGVGPDTPRARWVGALRREAHGLEAEGEQMLYDVEGAWALRTLFGEELAQHDLTQEDCDLEQWN
ncbi:uncharacterized protein LOC135171175 [Diachasmimorpha longicaudata]|uniref:uncharacterized protein LOC135171175 n=1 Tax=Diachasmimorpha longicaudata TaxID=58733 RepID=UPI0030B90C35